MSAEVITPSLSANDDNIDFISNTNTPIVFVVGFLSCSERFLEPVKRTYKSLQFETHVHIPVMYHKYKLERDDSKATCFMDDIYLPIVSKNPARPVFFHSFSHNGATLICLLWKLLNESQKKQVKAVAFDSAPSRFAVNPLYYVHTSFFTGYPKKSQNTLKWLQHLPFAVPRFCLWSLRLALKLKDNYGAELLEFDDLPFYQLYFFSYDDTMVSPPLIEEFVISQARKGKNVEMKTWKNGFHCGHHHNHAKDYAEATRKFVHRVMAERSVVQARL
ncbi:unnamed protein product [Bursaphelenchus xylophilus]|uniref:(pine wood nematode) hypothetical protein n=1 Tax=Bursaphelenchus xylophilus TaxID=6326 RepID=A0A7I8WKK2_BURXY|nr:unnamed protein product [Bursaphelenchus xylophilus]CAG9106662.1 unnamed protein product [Bursaphelenchus xylophilus]